MSTNVATSTFIPPPGNAAQQADKDIMCAAFRQAMDDFCSQPRPGPPKRGNFNNYMFKAMRDLKAPPASPAQVAAAASMAKNLAREVPMLVQTGAAIVPGTVAPGVSATLASTAAGTPGVLGQIGSAFVGATQTAASGMGRGLITAAYSGGTGLVGGVAGGVVRSCIGLSGFFGTIGSSATPVWQACRAAGVRVRFLDGLYRNTPIEIKGPHDSPRPQQLEDNSLLRKDGYQHVLDADSCGCKAQADACPK